MRARAAVCAGAVAILALGACGSPQGRLDATPDTRADGELRIGADSPLQVSTTVPPQVVKVPDKPGAANCKIVIHPAGCLDTYQQLFQLVGGGIDLTRQLGG